MSNDKSVRKYVEENLKKGYSEESIKEALVRGGHNPSSAENIIYEFRERKQMMNIVPYIILILVVSLSVFFINPAFIGFMTAEKEINYSDQVNIIIDSDYEYIWDPANKGEIKSIMLKGNIENKGSAKIYIENDNLSYKIFDSADIEGLSSITGAAVSGENQTSDENIIINLEYDNNTEYDKDNDGLEEIGNVIDFSVRNTEFISEFDKDKLCARWTVYSAEKEESNTICNGNEQCCNFVDLISSSPDWDDEFKLYYGFMGASFENIVSAQIIYVDYNFSVENLYSNISYSEWSSLSAKFARKTRLDNICKETCLLSGFDKESYKIIFELNNTVLNISDIVYSIVEEVNLFSINFSLIDSKGFVEHEVNVYKNDVPVKDINEVEEGVYDIEVIPEDNIIEKIKFKDVNISSDFSGVLGIENVSNISLEGIDIRKSYAVDPSGVDFKDATLKSVAAAPVLYKCADWNFTEQKCYGNWTKIKDLDIGEEYELEIDQKDPGFIEGFPESYNNAPSCIMIPNITIEMNNNYSFNLDNYCSDIDGDNLTYSYNPTENITIYIDENIAVITPDSNFIGSRYAFFIANDSQETYVSNIVNIKIIEIPEEETSIMGYQVQSSEDDVIPNTMNIQGKLTSANNTNLNGYYNFTFRIYNISEGGSALWEENKTLNVNDGIYDAIIGNTVSIDLDFDEQYYLGLSVNDDNEMSPRLNLTSSPYSRRSVMAENLTCTGCVATGEILDETIIAGDIAAGAVTSDEILDSTIIDADISANANINTSKINKTAGIRWVNELLTDIIDDIFDMINSTNTTSSIDLTNHTNKIPIDHPDESITNAKIAGDAVNTSQIIDESIISDDIKKDNITADRIANATITASDIAAGAGILESQMEKTFVDTAGDDMTGNLIGTGVNISYLNVSGTAFINILNVTGSTNIGDINISGVSFAEGDVSVNDNVNITSDGNIKLSQNLTAGQNAYIGGNLGVGTTAPSERLEVSGAVKLGTTSNANSGTIRFNPPIFQGYNGSDWVQLSSTGASTQWTTSGSNIYYDSGNVGIWATDPAYLLQVADTTGAGLSMNVSDVLYVNGSSGKVGIGTSSPSKKLDVEGNGSFSGNLMVMGNIVGPDDIASPINPMGWSDDGSVVRLADSSDLVGIGTNAPTAKLDVNGTINSLAVKTASLNVTGTSYLSNIILDGSNITADYLVGNGSLLTDLDIDNNTIIRAYNETWLTKVLENATIVRDYDKIGNTTNEIWNVVDNETFARLTGFSGENITSGTVADDYIADDITIASSKAINTTEGLNVSGSAYIGGNVGIGTTNPDSALTIAGNISPSMNNTYSLGTLEKVWKDVYLGGDSLYIDGIKLYNNGGTLSWGEENITTTSDIVFPSGFISMFNSSCPSGWTYLSAFEDRVPRGNSTYGDTGGSATHTHSLSDYSVSSSATLADYSVSSSTAGHTLTTDEMPSHTHTTSGTAASDGAHTHTIGAYNPNGGDHLNGWGGTTLGNTASTSSAGAHTHSVSGTAASTGGGSSHSHTISDSTVSSSASLADSTVSSTTDTGDSWNPYITVIFCLKD